MGVAHLTDIKNVAGDNSAPTGTAHISDIAAVNPIDQLPNADELVPNIPEVFSKGLVSPGLLVGGDEHLQHLKNFSESAPSKFDEENPILSAAIKGGAGSVASAADVLSSFTSPISLLFGGLSAASKAAPKLAPAAKIASGLFAAQGADTALKAGINLRDVADLDMTPQQAEQYFTGLSQAAMGTAGLEPSGKAMRDLVTPERPFRPMAEKISDLTEQNGGATFHPQKGDLSSTHNYAVSMFPERTRKVDSLTPEAVEKFIEDNIDLLKDKRAAVGTWKNPEDGKTYLDITATTPNKYSAIQHGKQMNQMSIYDLRNQKEIPTGGTGEPMDSLPPEQARLASLNFDLPKKEPFSGVHYSSSPVSSGVLEGARRGANKEIGLEKSRLDLGNGAEPGVYAYRAGTRGEPAITTRNNSYQIKGNYALADVQSDPVAQESFKQSLEDWKGKGLPDAQAYGAALNDMEHSLRDAGYDGYYSKERPNIVFLFGDHPVEKLTPQGITESKAASQRGSLSLKPIKAGSGAATGTAPARIPTPSYDEASIKNSVEKGGAKFVGIQKPLPEYNIGGLAYFNFPDEIAANNKDYQTTMALPLDKISPESIAQRLQDKHGEISQARPQLTAFEQQNLAAGKGRQAKFAATLESLPPVQEFVAAAKAGSVGRNWYDHAHQAFKALQAEAPEYFQSGDALRFSNVVAATSPQQAVNMNIREALGIWKNWVDAGRPLEGKALKKAIKPEYFANSKYPNLIKAFKGDELLSPNQRRYFKVGNFGQNLAGNQQSITNDSWMGAFAGLDERAVPEAPIYHAMSHRIRAAAKELNWHPAEAQAAVWSFIKTLGELGGWKGGRERQPFANVLDQVTPTNINKYKSDILDILLTDSDVRDKMNSLGVKLEQLDNRLKQIKGAEKATVPGSQEFNPELLKPAATRLEKIRSQAESRRSE